MRIGLLSYPMLFQRESAYQLQVRDSIRALVAVRSHQGRPVQVETLDPYGAALDDLIHVFGASGASYRLLSAAAARGVPVALSPLLAAPHAGLPAAPSFLEARHALQLAQLVVVQGQHERASVVHDFGIDEAKIGLLAPGIGACAFDADGELFRQRTGVGGPFVLMAGTVKPANGQRELAQALAAIGVPLLLLGETRDCDVPYLTQVRAVGGVTCLDSLKHDPTMLASAYAAAAVVVLPGQDDACVRMAVEALATGTPVVLGAGGKLPLAPCPFALRQLGRAERLHVPAAQVDAVLQLLATAPGRDAVRMLVRPLTWERAAQQMVGWYGEHVASRRVRSVAHRGRPGMGRSGA